MMLLIRRKTLVMLILLSTVAVLTLAAVGYVTLREAVALSAGEAKILSERVLFAGLVAAAILFVTVVVILVKVFQLSTSLSRIADLHRIGGYDIEPALDRLGDVGDNITRIYGHLTELSARKSMRIAAMNSLLNVIMARSSQRLLVVDPRGDVVRATPPALEFLDKTAGEVLGKQADECVPDVEFTTARAAIRRSGEPWMAEQSSFPVAVQPVENEEGENAYFVYYLGPEARNVAHTDPERDQPEAAAPEEPAPPSISRPAGRKDGVLSRLRRALGGR